MNARRADSIVRIPLAGSVMSVPPRLSLLVDEISSQHSCPNRSDCQFEMASSAATSARSFGRPAAFLLRNRAARPITGMRRSPNDTESPSAIASSNVTPSARFRISMRRGGRPIWSTPSYVVKSAAETSNSSSGAPNLASARYTRLALTSSARTRMSMSVVARGWPWNATACPPTSTNAAPARANSVRRSRKSSGRSAITMSYESVRGFEPFVAREWFAAERPGLPGEHGDQRNGLCTANGMQIEVGMFQVGLPQCELCSPERSAVSAGFVLGAHG